MSLSPVAMTPASSSLCSSTSAVAASYVDQAPVLSSFYEQQDLYGISRTIAVIQRFAPNCDEEKIRRNCLYVLTYGRKLLEIPGEFFHVPINSAVCPLHIVPGVGMFFDTDIVIDETTRKFVVLSVYYVQEKFLAVAHLTNDVFGSEIAAQDNKMCQTAQQELNIWRKIPQTADRIITHIYGCIALDTFHLYHEYAPGGSLIDAIELQQIQPSERLQFILDVLEGLVQLNDTLHIIHCDIKPDNCLITHDRRIKICDLGYGFDATAVAKNHIFGGTPEYDAPEMLDHLTEIKYDKIDPFAAGSTLLMVFTGQAIPWHGFSRSRESLPHRRDIITSYVSTLRLRANRVDALFAGLIDPDPQSRWKASTAYEYACSLTQDDITTWSCPSALLLQSHSGAPVALVA